MFKRGKRKREEKKKEFRFFSSFEDAGEFEVTFNASLADFQHLQNATSFLMERYKKELSKPNNNELYFKLENNEG